MTQELPSGAAAPSHPPSALSNAGSTPNETRAKPQQRVQLVGELPPAPRFSAAQIAEAEQARRGHQQRGGGAGAGNGQENESDDEDDLENGASVRDMHSDDSDADADGNDLPDSVLLDRYPDNETRIDLTHLKLTSKSLRKLGLQRFKDTLETLCLRQNEIARISSKDIGTLTKLKELDLYDNQLEKVGKALHDCTELETLDLSFNNFKHIPHVSHLAKCETLYLVQNRISRVRQDDLLPPLRMSLRSLELGGNRLRSMENLGELENLEELWLGKNKITKLENLDKMQRLRVLSIQSNRITKIENLDKLVNLEEFYISHNGLTEIEGLENNLKLTTVDVAGNQISQIKNVKHLKELEEFWANDCQISDINEIAKELGPDHLPKLSTVYLEGNPACRKEGPAYRRKLILSLPQVKQIDATLVRA